MEKHYIFSMPRAGWGYEPGDEVTPEFAAARPHAVTVVQAEKPKQDEPKPTGGDK